MAQAFHKFQVGEYNESVKILFYLLRINPKNYQALNLIGIIYGTNKNHKDALTYFKKGLKINPEDGSLNFNIAKAYSELGEDHRAIKHHLIAINKEPGNCDYWLNYGNSLAKQNQIKESISAYDKVIEINSEHIEAWFNKGVALGRLKLFELALECYDKVINHHLKLFELKSIPEIALEKIDRYQKAYNNQAQIYLELGLFQRALDGYDKAISLDPYYFEAINNKSLLLLRINISQHGYELFEMRHKTLRSLLKFNMTLPLWDGQGSTKRLLVFGEQGIGDQVMYGGVLPELRAYPQEKVVALERRLLALFKRSMPEMEFVDIEQLNDAEGFEEQIAIGSLPRLFRPDRDSFARVKSPYLVADAERAQGLREMVQRPGKRVCGVSWSSRREEIGQGKSIDLAQMLVPLAGAGMHFVNLQYGDTQQEREALMREHGIELQNVAEVDNFADIDGLAALIQACDLVITTSNTTVHLAGALGKETKLLVPGGRSRLWYWGQDQSRSIWYPTVRIYGQEKIGDWQIPLAQIKADLQGEGA